MCVCCETCAESNALLKLKFRELHMIVVQNVSVADVIDHLFANWILGEEDFKRFQIKANGPQQQCGNLLAFLHKSENPQAFIQLYLAIKEQPHLDFLVHRIDEFSDQSLVVALQQYYANKPSGECKHQQSCFERGTEKFTSV